MSDLNWKPHSLIELESGRLQCVTCKNTWMVGPTVYNNCPGIPVYPGEWSKVWVEGFMTKSQLNAAGYQTGKNLPKPAALLHWSKGDDGYLRLYDPKQATPKAAMTDTQKAAITKAQVASQKNWYCNRCENKLDKREYKQEFCDTCEAVFAAQNILKENWLILDTETTGLSSRSEIVELAIIDCTGQVLINTRIQPYDLETYNYDAAGAIEIHGIDSSCLQDAPMFADLYELIAPFINGQKLIIYKADFDMPILRNMCRRYGLPLFEPADVTCAMKLYAQYIHHWSYKHGNYRYYPLDGNHSALGDCRATLALIKEMASEKVSNQ